MNDRHENASSFETANCPPTTPAPSHGRFRCWVRRFAYLLAPVALLASLGWALAQTPDFYRRRLQDRSTTNRKELSDRFLSVSTRLFSDLHNQEPRWNAQFDEEAINAWFAKDLAANHRQSLPRGVNDLRIAIEDQKLRIGFGYSVGPFCTVVNVNVRMWVPRNNMLAVELLGASAGALPLPTSHTSRLIEHVAESTGCEVVWKRHNAHLIGLVKMPRAYRDLVLRRVETKTARLAISGRSLRSPPIAGRAPTIR